MTDTTREAVERLADQLRGEGEAHLQGNVRDRRTIGAIMCAGGETIRALLTRAETAEAALAEAQEREQGALALLAKSEGEKAAAVAAAYERSEDALLSVDQEQGADGVTWGNMEQVACAISALATDAQHDALAAMLAEAREEGRQKGVRQAAHKVSIHMLGRNKEFADRIAASLAALATDAQHDALAAMLAEAREEGRKEGLAKYRARCEQFEDIRAADRAEIERLLSERPYIVGWNDGFAFSTSGEDHPEEHLHSEGAADIARERKRQMRVEGWTPERDDQYTQSQLADAARCYLEGSMWGWPADWDNSWWKPKDRRSDLVRAGALIAAEIDRIDRAAIAQEDGE